MIYLLYGPDTVRSRQKLNEIIDEFRKRNGTYLNYYNFDAEEEDLGKIKGALETPSLFSPKKLVVVKYFSTSFQKDEFYKILEKVKDDLQTTILLWERGLDAEEIEKINRFCKKIQEFKETKKILPETSIFQLGDTFFSSRREGLRNLLNLLHQGHEDFNLFSYLVNHGRILCLIKSYEDQKKNVPGHHKIHPYVIKKAAGIVRTLSLGQLHSALRNFFEEDVKIKTGASKAKESLMRMLV